MFNAALRYRGLSSLFCEVFNTKNDQLFLLQPVA